MFLKVHGPWYAQVWVGGHAIDLSMPEQIDRCRHSLITFDLGWLGGGVMSLYVDVHLASIFEAQVLCS